jgi:uncharacterized protein YjbI with pentapeptide repeats
MMKISGLRAVAALLIGLIGLVGATGTLSLVGIQVAGAGVSCPGTGITLSGNHVSADWAGCDLSNDNFTGIELANSNLSDTILQPGETVNFTSAHLNNVNLTGANLTDANLTDANLESAVLTSATLSGTNFLDATLATSTAPFYGVVSGSITTTPINLSTALPSPAFGYTGWQLTDGYLVGPGAHLANANFTDPDLTNQDLTNANLTGATLTDPTLSNTNFNNSTLYGVSACGITGNPANLDDALPAGVPGPPQSPWQVVAGCLVGPGANLLGADFSTSSLASATLQAVPGALGVSSGSVTCPTALPTAWVCLDGYLVGPTANLDAASLTDANLTGVNLTGADLRTASLHDANLTDAVLTGTNLTGDANLGDATLNGVISTGCGITGSPVLPSGWVVADGCLSGPTAVVSTADAPASFTNLQDLYGLLSFASETISNATFTYSGNVNAFWDSDFTDANLSDSTFTIDPGSYLTFIDANFSGANLDGVSGLQSARFYSGVTWSNTICPDGTNSNSDGGTCTSDLNP